MKSTHTLLTLGVCAMLVFGSAAFAQQEDDSHMLQITRVEVNFGHISNFREGMQAWRSCYIDNDGSNHWSVWNNVDGRAGVFHIVSVMENWAGFDSPDSASRECRPVIEEQIAPHVTSVETIYARHMAEWSGEAEDYDVVRLHHFRAAGNGQQFRETVGEITGILKEAGYEHLGGWYSVIGGDSARPNYFVVDHYTNFADLDEDRTGPYQAVVDAVGEERGDALWEQFGESLRDDREYVSELLRRVAELGREPGND
jgi:hypothetical protein